MESRRLKASEYAGNSFAHAMLYTILYVAVGCHPLTNSQSQLDPIIIDPIVLIDSVEEAFDDLFAGSTAFAFYKSQEFVPVWSKNKIKTAQADSMIQLIRFVRIYGLLPQDYHLKEIETLLDTASTYNENFRTRKLDLLLTDAFFSIATHLKKGRFDITTAERIVHGKDSTQIELLQAAIDGQGIKKTLELQEPANSQYRQLRLALEELLQNTDTTERELLFAGNTIDSLVNSSKIATLEINLERWRMEAAFKDRYIFVNIPAFRLNIVEGDQSVFESKVIIGTVKTQTPQLEALIKSFTLYPYWQVPRNIAVNEILPHIKSDSNYLKRHRYDVLDINGNILDPASIDWMKFHKNNFPVLIRQREGYDNSLGIVKFSFNNPYGIYLHDTNARKLFSRDKRALSHGCVRVEKARELAHFLLRDDSVHYYPEDLDQYFLLKKKLDIKLLHPMSLYIRYFTCEYHDGAVEFYNDVYGFDKPLHQALYPKMISSKQF